MYALSSFYDRNIHVCHTNVVSCMLKKTVLVYLWNFKTWAWYMWLFTGVFIEILEGRRMAPWPKFYGAISQHMGALFSVHDFSVFDTVLINIWSIMGNIQKIINALVKFLWRHRAPWPWISGAVLKFRAPMAPGVIYLNIFFWTAIRKMETSMQKKYIPVCLYDFFCSFSQVG